MTALPDPLPVPPPDLDRGLARFFGPNHDRFKLDVALMNEPPTPPVYHVAGLIRRGTSTVLAGDSGTGKTTLTQDLAIATVQGGEWLGLDVAPGPVLYLHGEEPLDATADNLRALGLRGTDNDMHYWRGPLVLSQTEARRAVEEEIAVVGAVLVVFDSAVMLSGVDPNDNQAAASFMGWVSSLDCTKLTVHHEGKGGSDGSGGKRSAARAKKAVLGASQWTAQCDLLISVELDNPAHIRTESEGEVIDEFHTRVILPKERRFGATTGTRHITKWARGREGALLAMELRCTSASSAPAKPPVKQRMLDALREDPLSRPELAKSVGLAEGGGSFKGTVAELLRNGEAVLLKDARIALVEAAN